MNAQYTAMKSIYAGVNPTYISLFPGSAARFFAPDRKISHRNPKNLRLKRLQDAILKKEGGALLYYFVLCFFVIK